MRPRFDSDALREAWETWASARESDWLVKDEEYDYNESYPVVFADYHLSRSGSYRVLEHSTLPGGHTVLQTDGFVVSGGATHPEIAYALTKFLSRQLDLVANYSGSLPARRDIYGQAAGLFLFEDIEVVQRDFERLLPYAIPPRETVYLRYLSHPYVVESPVEAGQLLREAQEKALDDLARATAYEADIVIDKPESDFAPIVGATIRFGLTGDTWGLNEKRLKDFAAAYADQERDIGKIEIDAHSASPSILVEQFDCFYGGEWRLREMPISAISRLEPLMAESAGIDSAGFIPVLLDKATYQDVLWALPISLHPLALRYDAARLRGSWPGRAGGRLDRG